MADRRIELVNRRAMVAVSGAALIAPLVQRKVEEVAAPDRAAAEAAAAQAQANYQDMLDIQALGDDAAAIAARVPKNTDGSDFANPLAVRDSLHARPADGFLSVTEFYEVADGSDYGPALGRALAESPKVFWADGGHTISSAVDHTLTSETVIDWNDALVTFTGAGRVNLKSPIVASSRTLASNALRWATSIDLDDGSGIQAGDILNIQSNVLPADWPDNKQDTVRVRSVSGDTVTLEDGLNFAWDTAETGLNITVWRPAGAVKNLNLNFVRQQEAGELGRVCIYLEGVADWMVANAVIKGELPFNRLTNIERNGVVAYYCMNGLIDRLHAEAMSYPGLLAGGSRYTEGRSLSGRYNHHTGIDATGWSSDIKIDGMEDQDSFSGASMHASFRAVLRKANIRNNLELTAWRSCGGAILDSYIHSIDSTGNTPLIQSAVPSPGYEYIYADRGGLEIRNVDFDNPNRTSYDLYIHYGGRVLIENVRAYDIRIGGNVAEPVIKLPLNLAGGKAGPTKGLIESTGTQVPAPDVLDAYLDTGVYHIDPYRSLVPQSGRTLRCRGQIGRAMAAGTKPVRVHFNGFPGVSGNFLVGRLRVRASLQHQSAGYYSWLEKTWPFFFTGSGAVVELSTTAVTTVGPQTGSGGPDVTLTLANPAVTSGTDGFLAFDLTVDKGAGTATSAVYQLEYDLELTETST